LDEVCKETVVFRCLRFAFLYSSLTSFCSNNYVSEIDSNLKLEFVAFDSKRDFTLEFIAQLTFMLMYPNIIILISTHFQVKSGLQNQFSSPQN